MTYDCYCDYDQPEFYHLEIRKARKAHKCDECAGWVHPGELYEHVRGKWEGHVSSFNTCERCHDIYQWVKNNFPCVCRMHGDLIQECENAIEEATWRAAEETRGLRFGFLRRVVTRDKFNQRNAVVPQ